MLQEFHRNLRGLPRKEFSSTELLAYTLVSVDHHCDQIPQRKQLAVSFSGLEHQSKEGLRWNNNQLTSR